MMCDLPHTPYLLDRIGGDPEVRLPSADRLDARECLILQSRPTMTLERLGHHLGISRGRVAVLEQRAFRTLRYAYGVRRRAATLTTPMTTR